MSPRRTRNGRPPGGLSLLALASLLAACASPRPPARPPSECSSTRSSRLHEQVRPLAGDALDFHQVAFEVPVERSAFVAAFLREPLSTFIRPHKNLPGVDHTEPLTTALYPEPGSVRLVCLSDGSVADEEVLERTGDRLRYLVTNYSSPEAAAVRYGVGEFRFEPSPGGTRVSWTYSFALRGDRFPGSWGGLGRMLFRRSFVDGDYAEFMESQVRDMRAFAERVRSAPGGQVRAGSGP